MANLPLKEATARISCNPKKMKELLFEYGMENKNLKGTIQLASAMIDQCTTADSKKGKTKSKRAPSAYNRFIADCFTRHKGDSDYGFKPTGTKCRLEWKEKKG